MKGLRVERLAVANVGALVGEVDLGELDPAITLITGENEVGKSTVVEALRCALFERHDSKHAGLRALQPHGTALGPEIRVELALDERRYSLRKRFLVRPLAELRDDEGDVRTGREADEAVWQLLGSREPGSRGSKPTDMGIWGLLWVTQDEAAFTDPGGRLDDETRGALQEAIGRQVAQVIGGRHGERLRTRVREEAARYWTAKAMNPTGELVEARQEVEAGGARVQSIEAAIAEVEEQAHRHAATEALLAELKRDRPALEEELRRTEEEAADVGRLRTEAEGAASRLEAKQARLEAATERCEARRALARDLATLEEARAEASEVVAELERGAEERRERKADAAAALEEAVAASEEAREAREQASAALERARRAVEAQRRRERLEKARELVARREKLLGDAEASIDDATWAALGELEEERRRRLKTLEAEGTRLRWIRDGEEGEVVAGRQRELELAGGGRALLVPARAGLGAAVSRALEAETALAEALRGAGAGSMTAARAARKGRIEAEIAAEQAGRALADAAPEGVDALADAVAAGREALERERAALERAEGAAERAEALRAALEENALDERTLEKIEGLARDLDVARARHEAIGTGVGLQALDELEVALDEAAGERLGAGDTRRWTLTRPAKITIAGVAELEVEPGGEELRKAGALLEAAQATLDEALRDTRAGSLDEARTQGRAWRETEAALRDVRAALDATAPEGVATLREAVAAARVEQRRREERLETARKAAGRQRELQAALEANPLTEATMARLEELSAAAAEARGKVAELAARLELAGGEEARVIAEPTELELGDGLRLEVVPGRGGEEAEAALDRAEGDLTRALAKLGLDDLEAGAARWKAGLTLHQQLDDLEERLAELAPDGVEALAEAVGEEEPDAAAEADVAADMEALEEEAGEAGARWDRAEAGRNTASRAATEAAEALAAFEAELAGKREQLAGLERSLGEVRTRLDAARVETDDGELEERRAQAEQEAGQARTDLEAAEAALAAAAPELLDEETDRARNALAEARAREEELGRELVRLDALIGRAAAEGRFEELGEARAELAAAETRLRSVERQAAGAKLLAEEVERAYQAAQRRFLAPVVEAAQPYLNRIRPGTAIRMTPDLTLDSVMRRGTAEDFNRLSGGTREQLSVIVRLALARVLARDSNPLPLILDDTMGWTDDHRFLEMIRILRNAARELQIIILTCHPGRFARIRPGRSIDLDALRREAAAALAAGGDGP